MAQGLKFMFDRRFDLPEGSISSNVAEVVSSVLEEMNKPDLEETIKAIEEEETQEEAPPIPEPEPEITYSEQEMEDLKAEAFNQGIQKGLENAVAMREEVVKANLLTIAETVNQVMDRQSAFEKEQETGMMKLCLSICQKILPSLLKEKGEEEIKALLEKSLPDLHVEKHISVRVSEDNEKTIKAYIKKFLTDNGIESAVIVIKDESLGIADCVIEWYGGSIERKTEEVIKDIEKVLNTYTKEDDKQEILTVEKAENMQESSVNPLNIDNESSNNFDEEIENTDNKLPKIDENDKKEQQNDKDKLEKPNTKVKVDDTDNEQP